MNAFDFSKEVVNVCSRYPLIQEIEIQLLDEPVAEIKAVLGNDVFFNIFYNAETSKYSFALIKNSKRIYGADNTKNWHIHPFDNPDAHIETTKVSLVEFLETLASNRDIWFSI
jgi:hypothetical protein